MGDATSSNKSENSETSDSIESDSEAPLGLENAETEAEPELPAAEPQSHRSGWSAILGGVAAAIIGFLAATYADTSKWRVEQSDQAEFQATINSRLDELAAEVTALSGKTDTSALSERIEKISSDLQAFSTADFDTSDLTAQIETSQTQTAEDLSVLEDRLASIEDWKAVAGAALASSDGLAEDQLSEFRAELENLTAQAKSEVEAAQTRAAEVEAKAAEMAAQAEQQEREAQRQVALAALVKAIESGEGYAEPLANFDNAPKALTSQAAEGVATLSSLQRDFPSAAREALSMVQTVPQDASATDRLSAFLKRQTNARSLSPKEGDDPDAVLSRAEASLTKGDLKSTLVELALLPEPAKESMTLWIGKAEAREAALSALAELTNSVN